MDSEIKAMISIVLCVIFCGTCLIVYAMYNHQQQTLEYIKSGYEQQYGASGNVWVKK